MQRSFDNNPVSQHILKAGPTKPAVPIEQSGKWNLETDFEQTRQAPSVFVESEGISPVGTQNAAGSNNMQTSSPLLATAALQHPSAIAPERNFVTGSNADDASFQPLEEISETEFSRLNVNMIQNPPSSTAGQTTSAGVVRLAGTQIVDAPIRQPGQPLELTLNPEELGRVRISLTTLDSGISVAIMAERPETLDLMRRNIEQLEAEFRQLGYENIGFEFSGGGAQTSGQPRTNDKPASDQASDSTDQPRLSPMSASANSVDIRL